MVERAALWEEKREKAIFYVIKDSLDHVLELDNVKDNRRRRKLNVIKINPFFRLSIYALLFQKFLLIGVRRFLITRQK